MRRITLCCLLIGVFACIFRAGAGWAESARGEEAARRFPFEQRFVVTYVNGQDFAGKSLTFAVRREPGNRVGRGTGYAGCNTWFARIEVGDAGRLVVSDVGTTRKYCHRERIRTENEFLAILRSLDRWRMDGRNLILRGDKAILVLSPASRTASIM
jgi:heat shock protein HslJ